MIDHLQNLLHHHAFSTQKTRQPSPGTRNNAHQTREATSTHKQKV